MSQVTHYRQTFWYTPGMSYPSPEAPVPHELRHVKTVPNTEARHLTEQLGIAFTEIPQKVPLTFRNKVELVRNNIVRAFVNPEIIFRTGVIGRYVPGINAYIYHPRNKPDDTRVGLHENMHAYALQQPSPMKDVMDMFAGRRSLNGPPEKNAAEIEQYFVYSTVSEGIAEWGSAEAAGKLFVEVLEEERMISGGENRELVLDAVHKVDIYKDIFDEGEAAEKAYISSLVARLSEASGRMSGSVGATTAADAGRNIAAIARGFKGLDDTRYELGHYFVHEVMKDLTKQGMTTEEGLRLILAHPPEHIADLAEPEAYVMKSVVQTSQNTASSPVPTEGQTG